MRQSTLLARCNGSIAIEGPRSHHGDSHAINCPSLQDGGGGRIACSVQHERPSTPVAALNTRALIDQAMTSEANIRLVVDPKLEQAGPALQDLMPLGLSARRGVVVPEHPLDTGPADSASVVEATD